jgi:hypothetical protein
MNKEQSRRDDCEAIAYILLYLLLGVLPWQNLRLAEGEDKYKKIYLKKTQTTLKELCKNTPSIFQY